MAIEFLALPDEQRPWLKDILKKNGMWCWVRIRGGGSKIIYDPSAIEDTDFGTKNLVEFDLGRAAVRQPVFRETPNGVELDFPRSLAVQFAPSLAIDNCILTVGQLAISSRSWYDFYDVNPDPVSTWFRELTRSWRKAFCDENMVVVNMDDGRVSESRQVHVTAGAIHWWQQGRELKNLTNMTFKYDVVPRTPRKRSSQ
jgi:hypothetical protein